MNIKHGGRSRLHIHMSFIIFTCSVCGKLVSSLCKAISLCVCFPHQNHLYVYLHPSPMLLVAHKLSALYTHGDIPLARTQHILISIVLHTRLLLWRCLPATIFMLLALFVHFIMISTNGNSTFWSNIKALYPQIFLILHFGNCVVKCFLPITGAHLFWSHSTRSKWKRIHFTKVA